MEEKKNPLDELKGNYDDLDAIRLSEVTKNADRPIGELVQEFAELRDHLSAERKKFKELEVNLKSDMEALEVKILEMQRALGVQSISTGNHTAFQTKKVSVRMADWDQFSEWVLKTGNIHCLEKRCAKLACLEIEEDTNRIRGEDDTKFDLAEIGLSKMTEVAIQIRKK